MGNSGVPVCTGSTDGSAEGSSEGCADGACEGSASGPSEGGTVGASLGITDAAGVCVEETSVSSASGAMDAIGVAVGACVSCAAGVPVGAWETAGPPVSNPCAVAGAEGAGELPTAVSAGVEGPGECWASFGAGVEGCAEADATTPADAVSVCGAEVSMDSMMTVGSPSAQTGSELRTMSMARTRHMALWNRLIKNPLPFRIVFKLNISQV